MESDSSRPGQSTAPFRVTAGTKPRLRGLKSNLRRSILLIGFDGLVFRQASTHQYANPKRLQGPQET
jgi:hypothetical protein